LKRFKSAASKGENVTWTVSYNNNNNDNTNKISTTTYVYHGQWRFSSAWTCGFGCWRGSGTHLSNTGGIWGAASDVNGVVFGILDSSVVGDDLSSYSVSWGHQNSITTSDAVPYASDAVACRIYYVNGIAMNTSAVLLNHLFVGTSKDPRLGYFILPPATEFFVINGSYSRVLVMQISSAPPVEITIALIAPGITFTPLRMTFTSTSSLSIPFRMHASSTLPSQTLSLSYQISGEDTGGYDVPERIPLTVMSESTQVLFAITNATACAESLPYGACPSGLSESDSAAFICTNTYGNHPHNVWIQKATIPFMTPALQFVIHWQFRTIRSLRDRFAYATTNGEMVQWRVEYQGATYNMKGMWYYSTAFKFATRPYVWQQTQGRRFSSDDGIWGAAPGALDGDRGPSLASYTTSFGQQVYASYDDFGCQTLYMNGGQISSTSLKNYMYLAAKALPEDASDFKDPIYTSLFVGSTIVVKIETLSSLYSPLYLTPHTSGPQTPLLRFDPPVLMFGPSTTVVYLNITAPANGSYSFFVEGEDLVAEIPLYYTVSGTSSDVYGPPRNVTIDVLKLNPSAPHLFAITTSTQCAEQLPYGPCNVRTFDRTYSNAFICSGSFGTWMHNAWSQHLYDNNKLMFTILYLFNTTDTLANRFIHASTHGVPVRWEVLYNNNIYSYRGVWWFSSGFSATNRFDGSYGSAFSVDDGLWGAANGILNANSFSDTLDSTPGSWGQENDNLNDYRCRLYYMNGTKYQASATIGLRNYMSLYTAKPCLKGQFLNSTTDECQACPRGTHSPSRFGLPCSPCPSGSYAGTTGRSSCMACEQNEYSNRKSGSTFCVEYGQYKPSTPSVAVVVSGSTPTQMVKVIIYGGVLDHTHTIIVGWMRASTPQCDLIRRTSPTALFYTFSNTFTMSQLQQCGFSTEEAAESFTWYIGQLTLSASIDGQITFRYEWNVQIGVYTDGSSSTQASVIVEEQQLALITMDSMYCRMEYKYGEGVQECVQAPGVYYTGDLVGVQLSIPARFGSLGEYRADVLSAGISAVSSSSMTDVTALDYAVRVLLLVFIIIILIILLLLV